MSSKPVYSGSYEQYQNLPYEVRKYYAPPGETPLGYQVSKVETVTPTPRSRDPTKPLQKTMPMTIPYEQVTFTPKTYEVPTSLFGPKTEYYDPKTGVFTEELTTRKGEKIFVTVDPRAKGPKTPSPLEQQAISGATLATTTAVGVGVPMAGLTALGTVGAVATVKGAIVGEPLTPEEAIGAASAGTLLYFGASRFAPYARQAYRGAYSRLFPERAMYNRVVGSQQPSTPLSEKIVGRLSPERALYNRVTRLPSARQPPEGGDFITGGGGGAQQWVQQQLVRQAPVQKASMKPFVSTVQTVVPKTVVVPSQSNLVKTVLKTEPVKTTQKARTLQQTVMPMSIQQQVQNPFLRYQGKPFFQQRSREELEYVFYSYPAQSPLAKPETVTRVTPIQRQGLLPKTQMLLEQSPTQVSDVMQTQSQVVREALSQKQAQRQLQEQILGQTQQQQQIERYWNLGGFDFPSGFRRRKYPVIGGYGRYKRVYPLISPSRMLKEVLK